MNWFVDDDMKVVFGFVALVWFGLQYAARRFPEVEWLQALKLPELSPRQKRIAERRANFYAGVEFILLGLAIPMGYVALTVMTFNDFERLPTVLVALTSAVCIGIGIFALSRNARG